MYVYVTVKKLRKCKQSQVYSSSLIVGVASVAKCWRQHPNFAFAGSCTVSEYFPSICLMFARNCFFSLYFLKRYGAEESIIFWFEHALGA